MLSTIVFIIHSISTKVLLHWPAILRESSGWKNIKLLLLRCSAVFRNIIKKFAECTTINCHKNIRAHRKSFNFFIYPTQKSIKKALFVFLTLIWIYFLSYLHMYLLKIIGKIKELGETTHFLKFKKCLQRFYFKIFPRAKTRQKILLKYYSIWYSDIGHLWGDVD